MTSAMDDARDAILSISQSVAGAAGGTNSYTIMVIPGPSQLFGRVRFDTLCIWSTATVKAQRSAFLVVWNSIFALQWCVDDMCCLLGALFITALYCTFSMIMNAGVFHLAIFSATVNWKLLLASICMCYLLRYWQLTDRHIMVKGKLDAIWQLTTANMCTRKKRSALRNGCRSRFPATGNPRTLASFVVSLRSAACTSTLSGWS